jgi:hypothetical protein
MQRRLDQLVEGNFASRMLQKLSVCRLSVLIIQIACSTFFFPPQEQGSDFAFSFALWLLFHV